MGPGTFCPVTRACRPAGLGSAGTSAWRAAGTGLQSVGHMEGRRWARLAARRGAELLRAAVAGPVAVVVPGRAGGALVSDPSGLPAGAFDAVADATPPDGRDAVPARVAALVRACRPGGTVALIACGGDATAAADVPTVTTLLDAAGADVVRVVAFDLLGPSSPWRRRLGDDSTAVVAELEAHLAFPAVRIAARLLEREVVAASSPSYAASAVVIGRRRDGEPAPEGAAPASLAARLAGPALARRALALAQDDAVVRFAAFLAAEVQPVLAAPFDVARWLLEVAGIDGNGDLAAGRARAAGRSWYPGLDARRFVEAAAHRMARGVVRALAAGAPEQALVADSFEYPVLETCNAALDICLGGR
jgi:hypothetical protein